MSSASKHFYFDHCPPVKWNIHDFLDASLKQSTTNTTQFDFLEALKSYRQFLVAQRECDDNERQLAAKILLNNYNKRGRSSDKSRASNWAESRNLTGRKLSGKRQIQRGSTSSRKKSSKQAGRVVIGTYVRGSINNSKIKNSPIVASETPDDDSHIDTDDDVVTGLGDILDDLSDDGAVSDSGVIPDGGATSDDGAVREEPSSSQRFLGVCEEIYGAMEKGPALASGTIMQDICYNYAMQLENLHLLHWGIIDLEDPDFLKLFSSPELVEIKHKVMTLPMLPKVLDSHILRYHGVTTRKDARKIAFTSEHEDEGCDNDTMFLLRWISDCFDYVISLITESYDLLLQPYPEGFLICLLSRIFDQLWINDPNLIQERYFSLIPVSQTRTNYGNNSGEITLLAQKRDPHPILPYSVLYDGIVYTRLNCTVCDRRLAFALIEVSKQFLGLDGKKWEVDQSKLFAGMRACLWDIGEAVEHHTPTMKKVAVVGMLQAGLVTKVFIMSYWGYKMYYLQRGTSRTLPQSLDNLQELGDLLTVLWKCREIVRCSFKAVENYRKHVKPHKGSVNRMSPSFL